MDKRPPSLDADRRRPIGAYTALGAAVCVVLLALLWLAIERQSLIGDAAYHLLAGDQALRYGTNQLNLEHPPLVKLVAALPLLGEEPLAPPVGVDRAIETSLELFADPARTRRAQMRSRTLQTVAFALPLLACCFALGARWGQRAGYVLALSVGLSFAVLPFLPVIQTDTAVTLGFVATVLALLRYLDGPGPTRAGIVGAALGLAMASKYSGILLWPSAIFALACATVVRPASRSPGGGHLQFLFTRLRDLTLVLLASGAVLYATYAVANHDYDPTLGHDTIQRYLGGEGMITGQEMQRHAELLYAAERIDPNLAQWLAGFLGIRTQNQIGVYPSYAFGGLSTEGRWWYFPAVLLIKTPLALLLASAAALGASVLGGVFRRRSAVDPSWRSWRETVLLLITIVVYLAVAMSSSYNLGVRHLMPILPLLYLPAALWAARNKLSTALLVGALAVEALTLTPLWMSATNTWWLGSRNPTRFALSGSDTEYRQNFLALARAADSRQIETLHVIYPLLEEKELRAYIPRARLARPDDPLEPGQWYAVSILVEQYLPAIPRATADELRGHDALISLRQTWAPLWQQVTLGEDHGYVAGSFHLYRLADNGTAP